MKEFRPADVIDEDTRLAASLVDGDVEALGALVTRYGRAVHAVVSASPDATRVDPTVDVFARVWLERASIEPGSDFAPWIGSLASAAVGKAVAEVENVWSVAMAIDSVDDVVRPVLRSHHVDGVELPDGADRHELRLRRRLAHLDDDEIVAAALGDPHPWSDPDADLIDQITARLGVGPPVPDVGQATQPDGAVVDGGAAPGSPGRVARSLRPVFLGLAGAVTVLFVAIVALSAASGSADPVVLTADLTPTGAIRDVEAGELTVTEGDSGLRLDLEAPTLPRRAGDQFYEGVLVLQDGTELQIGTFNEGFGVILAAGVSLDRVDRFVVVARELGSDDSDVILKLDLPRN